jgi:hypothetical protein
MIEESKIREKAYELWEKDGRPEGSEQFYWRLAQDQLGADVQVSDATPLNFGPDSLVQSEAREKTTESN